MLIVLTNVICEGMTSIQQEDRVSAGCSWSVQSLHSSCGEYNFKHFFPHNKNIILKYFLQQDNNTCF